MGFKLTFNQQKIDYLNFKDMMLVMNAYDYAFELHKNIRRKDGADYISHPLAVAEKLAEIHMNKHVLMAALLHDTIEDTNITEREIKEKFGVKVAELVQGLTKLEQLEKLSKEEKQAKNLEKMILAMAQDISIIIIKLADRLHNMETLCSMKPESQRRIAKETQIIYVQLAGKLGMYLYKRALENLSFQYLYPYRYQILTNKIQAVHQTNVKQIERIKQQLVTSLEENKLLALVLINHKNIARIYKAMKETKSSFDVVTSGLSYSIIVDKRSDCYQVLGIVHELFQPIPGRFTDYIAMPKSNGYQSLHTKVIGDEGNMIEIQILTTLMKKISDYGIVCCELNQKEQRSKVQKNTTKWLEHLVQLQKNTQSSEEYFEEIKTELIQDKIQVLSPEGRVYEFPNNATALDYAYKIHTEIGEHAISAIINNKSAQLSQQLKTGDVIKIATNSAISPKQNWLEMVRTSKAKANIRRYLRKS